MHAWHVNEAFAVSKTVSFQPVEVEAMPFGREPNIRTPYPKEKGKLGCLVIDCFKLQSCSEYIYV
jgi:hypothetical protein